MTFDRAVEIVLLHEGGYVNDSHDAGGETKYGISKRSYPHLDIKNLSFDHAKSIYKKDYWDFTSCDKLPSHARLLVFDCAVNQGVTRAILFMQRSIGVTVDGLLGPITLRALGLKEPRIFISEYIGHRFEAYTKNPHWNRYGRGWMKRLFDMAIKNYEGIILTNPNKSQMT